MSASNPFIAAMPTARLERFAYGHDSATPSYCRQAIAELKARGEYKTLLERTAPGTNDEDYAPRCITTGQHRNDGRGMCIDCDYAMGAA